MKLTVYVYACISRYAWREGEVEHNVSLSDDMEAYGFGKCVGKVEVDVPDIARADLVSYAVSTIRGEQQRVRAEAETKAQELEAQIGKLLALENGGATC